MGPHAAPGDFPDVHAVHADGTALNIVKPHEQVDEGGFSAAGGANNGNPAAGYGRQVQVFDEGAFRIVGEGNVPHLHLAVAAFLHQCLRRVRNLRGFVQDGKDPLGRGEGRLQLSDDAGYFIEWFGVLVGVAQKHGDGAHGHAAVDGKGCPGDSHRRVDHSVDEPGAGI